MKTVLSFLKTMRPISFMIDNFKINQSIMREGFFVIFLQERERERERESARERD